LHKEKGVAVLTKQQLAPYEARVTDLLFNVKDMTTEQSASELNRQFQDSQITIELMMIELFDDMAYDEFSLNLEVFRRWLFWRVEKFKSLHFSNGSRYLFTFDFLVNKIFTEVSYVHPQTDDDPTE